MSAAGWYGVVPVGVTGVWYIEVLALRMTTVRTLRTTSSVTAPLRRGRRRLVHRSFGTSTGVWYNARVMRMNAVSLFAGVGGIDLALESAGIPVVAAVEIDDAARGVLRHRFPDVSLFSDVCEVTPDDLLAAGFNPGTGVLAGGFPCQDLSVAGKRAGLDGKRSGLFWEIIRLAEALKPQWLLLENVVGLLSSNGGRDMGTVIGALGDLGYGVGWRVLDAQFFGVPQRRRRVFLVCCLGDDGSRAGEVLAVGESSGRDLASRRATREDIANALAARLGTAGLDDNAALNGHIVATTSNRADDQIVPTVTSKWVKGGGPAGDEAQNLITFVKAKRAQSVEDDESWREDGIAPTLNVFDIGDTRATVLSVFPIQGSMIGRENGGPAGPGFGAEGDPSFTLTRSDQHAIAAVDVSVPWAFDSTGGSMGLNNDPNVSPTLKVGSAIGIPSPPAVTVGTVVRRLTPLECERLQGFPDRWTLERWDWKKQAVVEQADGPRYKQMGNAVAVPCVAWIARRIADANARLTADAQACEDAPGMDIPCTPITGDTP